MLATTHVKRGNPDPHGEGENVWAKRRCAQQSEATFPVMGDQSPNSSANEPKFRDRFGDNDDDSESMCVDAPPAPAADEIVCYGAWIKLCDAKLRMESTSLQDFPVTAWSRFYELEIFQRDTHYYLRQRQLEKELGMLDVVTTETLKSLRERSHVTQIAVLDASALPKPLKKKAPHVMVDISVNLSGPSHMIDVIGDDLTKSNGFLQHPCFLPARTPYVNPHYYYSSGLRTDLTHLIGPRTEDAEALELSHGLSNVLNSLAEADCHQKEGIISILKREEGDYTASATGVLKSYIGNKPVSGRHCRGRYGPRKVLDYVKRCGVFIAKCSRVLPREDGNPDNKGNPHYHHVSALLQGIMWFRVVLDEAHWIRNTSSQQFKAAKELKAQRRWCLSGTPIQNTLDDLRSLLDFLHFKPFSEPGFFRKHIIESLHVSSLDPFRNLRLLLRITCFRRTAELICLPPHETREITVSLSDMETNLYDGILDRCKEEFEEISYGRSNKKRYALLFAATMRLRRLCNHGTFKEPQHSPRSETPRRKGKASSRNKSEEASDEPMCAYCYGDNADISADMGALEVCPECSRVLDQGTTASLPLSEGEVTAHGARNHQTSTISNLLNIAHEGDLHFSSKLNAVVDNIRNCPSSKQIVNSRIDGRTSFAERELILQEFSRENGPSVLLLSIATGAVGLTLTVADKVHIVEPQWNPSVEEQDIGRALRMGQQRNVTIYKYIAKRTVEENIVFLQMRKSHLAKISFDGHAGSQGGDKLDDMLSVIPPTSQHKRHPLLRTPHTARQDHVAQPRLLEHLAEHLVRPEPLLPARRHQPHPVVRQPVNPGLAQHDQRPGHAVAHPPPLGRHQAPRRAGAHVLPRVRDGVQGRPVRHQPVMLLLLRPIRLGGFDGRFVFRACLGRQDTALQVQRPRGRGADVVSSEAAAATAAAVPPAITGAVDTALPQQRTRDFVDYSRRRG
ncbi:SNF2 family N-terminal domain-containing protein [Apiospora saccharicola]